MPPAALRPWHHVWPAHVPHRLDYPDVPAWWLLEQNLPRCADRVAVRELHHETGSVGRVLTYAQLWRAVRGAARGLREHGVAPGVHVGFCLPNSSALIVGYYATWCAGGTVVPANPAARDSEVTEQFTDARVGLIVGAPGGPGHAAAVRLAVPATALAKERLGNALFANMIMLGALTRAAHLDYAAMRAAMLEVIPRFHDQNLAAMEIGYTLPAVMQAA